MFFIYKIWKEDDENFYIGSTCDFRDRKRAHKGACNNPTYHGHHLKIYQHIRSNGGWCSWNMNIIEECETRDREIEIIKEMKPSLNTKHYEYQDIKEYIKEYNKNNADRISERQKEYNKKNADKLKAYFKEYRKENADRIKEMKSKKFNCECGGKYTYSYKSSHMKTQRHQKYLGSS